MDRPVDVEQKYLGLLLLNDPVVGEVDDAAAIDEKEHFNFVVCFGLLNSGPQLRVGCDWVHLVLDVLALEHFLSGRRSTEKILRVQRESRSTAAKITMET